jgi:thiamine-phosphate pyrophosphorylase
VSLPRLLLLTDRTQLPAGRDLVDTVRRCADAGLESVVVRETDLSRPQRADLVRRIRQATGGAVAVITAGRWLCEAAGVHLAAAQTGLDGRPAPFHGRSCHDDGEIRRAVGGGASYLTISPVAETPSKPGYGPPLATAGVRRAVELADRVPVFALGGVDEHNAAAMRDAGAYGVAVMGAVMRADDPVAVFRRIHDQMA